jgi:DNA-directed RNA polymerase specialized sigma24 family protein
MCAYLVKTIDAFQKDFTPPQWNMWVKKFTWLRASEIFKREQNRYAKVDYLEKKSQDLTSQVETQDKYQRVMYVMNNQQAPNIKLGMKMLEKYAIGYKYEELADRYNVPVGTVKHHIHIARKTLKQAV